MPFWIFANIAYQDVRTRSIKKCHTYQVSHYVKFLFGAAKDPGFKSGNNAKESMKNAGFSGFSVQRHQEMEKGGKRCNTDL
jgi:hypothetical protein